MSEFHYVYENGKTFYTYDDIEFERVHDEHFAGMRFKHRRCPFCNRITSKHTHHWLNHTIKCAPLNYSFSNLLDLKTVSLFDLPLKHGKISPADEIHPDRIKQLENK